MSPEGLGRMRVSLDEKARSHTRIVESASRLLRERGLEGASVADVMRDAGLTHGGFYKHFDTKDALAEAALDAAFAQFRGGLAAGGGEDALARFRALYLSLEHLAAPGRGCPAAALGPEVARGPVGLKAAFGRGVRRIVDGMARARGAPSAARRAAALRDFSTLVGAMVIARASDPDFAREVLAACRARDPKVV